MHVIKPMKVGILQKMFAARGEFFFGIEALLFTDFTSGGLASDIGMWSFLGAALAGAPVDEAIPKSRGEFLVAGSAYPPGGAPATTCRVRAKVGDVEKVLYTIGDRVWQNGVQTPPEPFSEMPLDWTRAFGGEGFDKNPIGKGAVEIPGPNGKPVRPLPNIEAEGRLISSPQERPDPAGFRPYDITWPQRARRAGTYDERWIKERFPGYPDDIDWTIHNTAPENQWAREHWAPDASYAFENLHPTKPLLEGRLPNFVPRAYVIWGEGAKKPGEWVEVPLSLATLWFFPSEEKVLLGFSGATPCREDDGADVGTVVLAAEHAGRPKGMAHYREVVASRQGYEQKAVIARFHDEALLPEGIPGDLDEATALQHLVSPEGALRRNQMRGAREDWERAREAVKARGRDPDEVLGPSPFPSDEECGPPKKMSLSETLQMVEEQLKRADEEKERAEALRDEALQQVDEVLRESNMNRADLEAAGKARVPPGAPIQWAHAQRDKTRAMLQEFRASGWPQEEQERVVESEEYFAQLLELEQMQRDAYRATAHLEDEPQARPFDRGALEGFRAWIEAELARGNRSFRGRDLTGVDLSGLDLTDADFSRAFMEFASFENATLTRTNFSKTVLVRTTWDGARLNEVRFKEANLGRAKLNEAVIETSLDLKNAILDKASLDGLSLAGSRMEGVRLVETTLQSVDLSGVVAPDLTFMKCTLSGVSFAGATLKGSDFAESSVLGCDFSEANLEDVSFVTCTGHQAKFTKATMLRTRLAHGSKFDDCDFSEAKLGAAHLRGCSLKRGRFLGATVDQADFSGADLEGADFTGARGRNARFTRAKLVDARLERADLMLALLDKADLSGTSFKGGNLFMSDFALTRSDARTDVSGAHSVHVKIYPLRKPEESDAS